MGELSFEILIFLFLLLAAAALGAWFLVARAANARRRMTCMMDELGLDRQLLTTGGPRVESIFEEARKRCLRCRSEDLCERWLANRAAGYSEDDFCPNAAAFKALAGQAEKTRWGSPGEAG